MNNDYNWYHGKLTRDEAEILLKNDGRTNGLFLVRYSSAGDYALSVFNKNVVHHFQIRRHGDDAFFSIAENCQYHGLESLIEHYSSKDSDLPDSLVLTDYIIGVPPPADARRHGKTNLLHRATTQGNYTIVTECLNAGRQQNQRDKDGQTAVHIASKLGLNDILRKLIEFGANVNLRDSSGLTPLHYACQNNFPSTIRLLVNANANIQARSTENSCVPLHDAAICGHKDVINELLSLNVPVRPRNSQQKTPADLARENGHLECALMLENCQPRLPKSLKKDWYHGTLSRKEAEDMIRSHCYETGTYLVRYSDRNASKVLTLLCDGNFFNYIIQSCQNNKRKFLFIDDGPFLDSLEHIVDYYSFISDGLPTKLVNPVPPKPKPPVPFDTMPRPKKSKNPGKPLNPEAVNLNNNCFPSQKPFKNNFAIGNNNNISHTNNNNNENEDYISLDKLKRGNIIGEGEFGSVYKGTYVNLKGEATSVAIKTLREDQVNQNNIKTFLVEVQVMQKLDHECIVRLIGICKGPPLQMVQEYLALGSILQYMDANKEKIRPNHEFKMWAAQIAIGMNYLEQQRFVHRDLAARNILLATPEQAKISDFGLSRMVGMEDFYRASTGGKWPLKWYAPESYNYAQFSHKSDVWSFGVTIWEMFSFGAHPWGDMKGAEAIKLIDSGQRLEQPNACPKNIYDVMLQCWDFDMNRRPTFSELVKIFQSEPEHDYMNIV
ncbi:unnamed protein product [Brassicogethes aeneus]|uniref:Tyrosine-protein kinase n=1 Tax=Brassicogethes aeneus TaxID=1431903 RepID=A0A9P0BHG2_BRAAE|nr:unnamed protein product [Brassicogethes aeneus]